MNPLLPILLLGIPFLAGLVELLRSPKPDNAALPRLRSDSEISTALPESLVTAEQQEDIVSFLKLQHREIRTLFAETLAASGEERQARFLALRRLIAAHEATEEELVHPLAKRSLGANGYDIVVARLTEEREAATLITCLEGHAVDTLQFELAFRELQVCVMDHANHEEREEFPAIAGMKSDHFERVQNVARALYEDSSLLQGRQFTRDIGPFVAMQNRAKDVLAGKLTYDAAAAQAS